jgi:hypothetical protein
MRYIIFLLFFYVVCPKQKKNIPHFQNQRCIGIFMSLLTDNLIHVSLLLFEIQFFEIRQFLHTKRNVLMGLEETPRNIPVWQKTHQSIPPQLI